MERDIAVQKLGELKAGLQQTRSAISETQKRITSLKSQLASAPARITTQVRTENAQLVQQLKSSLLQLETKHAQLLRLYQPTYKPVQEVEAEITKVRTALADAEKAPISDTTTDRDPTYDWMRSELAKARTELMSLQAREIATTRGIADLETSAETLNVSGIAQQDLQRKAKSAEDNYQLYVRKREEARIADAMDQSRISNVSIAQEPTTPFLPSRSPMFYFAVAFVLAAISSVIAAMVSEYRDDSIRTSSDVYNLLNAPVLVTLPPARQ
jgi:uncharacterized protein involved in exopolysaccharide biosynthesis